MRQTQVAMLGSNAYKVRTIATVRTLVTSPVCIWNLETMKPTYLLDVNLKPVSALVRKSETCGLAVGFMLVLQRDVELKPYGVLPAGTKGYVSDIDDATGEVTVKWEGHEPALASWYNIVVLVPFASEDMTDAMVVGMRALVPVQMLKIAGQ